MIHSGSAGEDPADPLWITDDPVRDPLWITEGGVGSGWSGASEAAGLQDPGQELPGPGLARVGEHLLRRPLLADHAGVQEDDPIRRLPGEAHLVGGHDD